VGKLTSEGRERDIMNRRKRRNGGNEQKEAKGSKANWMRGARALVMRGDDQIAKERKGQGDRECVEDAKSGGDHESDELNESAKGGWRIIAEGLE